MTRAHDGVEASRAARSLHAVAVVVLITVAMLWSGMQAGSAEADVPDSGHDLTVDVEGGAVQPSPTTSPSPQPSQSTTSPPPSGGGSSDGGGSGGGTGGGSGSGSAPVTTGDATQATIPDKDAADEALGDEPADYAGVLAMSGLTVTASPSITVGNGHVTLDFVVRNLSQTTFDSTARFWVDNAFGGRIADIDDIEVKALEPDETRRVQIRIEGMGQQVVLHAHATFTPPAAVEGVELDPISRETSIAVPPWFALSLISGLGVLSGLFWWFLNRGGLALRAAGLGA